MTKTATIKLRVEEDEKLNWEAQATADGVSLSSLIRHRMNHPTTRADGPLLTTPGFMSTSMSRPGDPKTWTTLTKPPDAPSLEYISTRVGGASDEILDRRITTCEHGRPHYVFCPTCDA